MKPACPRLFEVEALRDGRLTGAERARFESHLGVCPTCAHEAEALEGLAASLRSPTSSRGADELHVRRERTRLLAAFDASLVAARRSPRANLLLRTFAVAATLSVLTVLAIVVWPARQVPAARVNARSPDPVTVRAEGIARWSRHTEGQLDKIVLRSGVLSIRIDHAVSRRRLLVVLPDGELEDIGTTFSVSADAGHTTRVTVQDGSVVLRLHGKPPLALFAGDSWTPAPAPTVPPVPSAPTPSVLPRSVKSSPSAAPARGVVAAPLDPSADFRAAMAAFNSGDNPRAAQRFAAFLDQNPSDPRAQDAAYLRVLALQRSDDAVATREAARDYLRRYPRGFRRAEVEALAR
jgi:hypothetical protein